MSRFLTNTPNSVAFLDSLSLPRTGKLRYLGDPDKVGSALAPAIRAAWSETDTAVQKVMALKNDKTRSDPEKHHLARLEGRKLSARFAATRTAVEQHIALLIDTATNAANERFAPSASRASLESDIRAWVREKAAQPDGKGMAAIREAVAGSTDVASVVFHTPHMLMNLAQSVHTNLRFEAMKAHLPDEWQRVEQAEELTPLPGRIASAEAEARTAFANPAIADQYGSRVEV